MTLYFLQIFRYFFTYTNNLCPHSRRIPAFPIIIEASLGLLAPGVGPGGGEWAGWIRDRIGLLGIST